MRARSSEGEGLGGAPVLKVSERVNVKSGSNSGSLLNQTTTGLADVGVLIRREAARALRVHICHFYDEIRFRGKKENTADAADAG